MQTKQYAAKGRKAKRVDLRSAIAASQWKTSRNLARHIGCHENTLNAAARAKRLPANKAIAIAVAAALGLTEAAK